MDRTDGKTRLDEGWVKYIDRPIAQAVDEALTRQRFVMLRASGHALAETRMGFHDDIAGLRRKLKRYYLTEKLMMTDGETRVLSWFFLQHASRVPSATRIQEGSSNMIPIASLGLVNKAKEAYCELREMRKRF